MKKITAVLLTLVILVGSLSGCGDKKDNTSPDDASAVAKTETSSGDDGSKVVKVGISGTVETLNPLAIFTTGTWATLNAYYERLAAYEADCATITGQLAKGWSQVEENVYDVEIYDYIKDWNGNAITADDVVFCYETAKEQALSGHLNSIDKIEKVDDYTIRFTLTENYVMTIENILQAIDIVSQKEYEASSDQMALSCVGTGRYKVVDFVPSSSITLQKNEEYWQTEELTHYRSSGEADEIQIISILEDAQMAVALETGTIDVAKIPSASSQRFMNNEAYDSFDVESTAGYFLRFSGAPDSVFYQNPALRQAVCYAIDVNEIIAGAYNSDAVPMTGVSLPTRTGYQKKWLEDDYYSYNLDKAKELLAEAGYKEGELTIRLLVLQNDVNKAWATIIQAQLAKIGINVEVDAKDNALWYSQGSSGDYDICGWNVTMSHESLDLAAAVGSEIYYSADQNPALTEVLNDEKLQNLFYDCMKVDTCSDETIDACYQYIKDQAYVYGLCFPVQHTFARKDLQLSEPGYATNYILVPNTFKYAD